MRRSRVVPTRRRASHVAAPARLAAALALTLALVPRASADLTSEGKCSACQAVVSELVDAVRHEAPSMNLDLRNRLDSSGQRHGTVVDYAVSELRAIEMIEQLCEGMPEYGIVEMSRGEERRKFYRKRDDVDKLATDESGLPPEDVQRLKDTVPSAERQRQGVARRALYDETLALKTYCEAVLEEHDEEVTRVIRSVKPGDDVRRNFYQHLCVDLAGVCEAEDIGVNAPINVARRAAEGRNDAGGGGSGGGGGGGGAAAGSGGAAAGSGGAKRRKRRRRSAARGKAAGAAPGRPANDGSEL